MHWPPWYNLNTVENGVNYHTFNQSLSAHCSDKTVTLNHFSRWRFCSFKVFFSPEYLTWSCVAKWQGVWLVINGSLGPFFVGVSLGKTLQNPNLVLVKLREYISNVSCRRDITVDWLIDWLIDCLTPFSTVFQLYPARQCTYPFFPGVLLTITPHNILILATGCFPT